MSEDPRQVMSQVEPADMNGRERKDLQGMWIRLRALSKVAAVLYDSLCQ